MTPFFPLTFTHGPILHLSYGNLCHSSIPGFIRFLCQFSSPLTTFIVFLMSSVTKHTLKKNLPFSICVPADSACVCVCCFPQSSTHSRGLESVPILEIKGGRRYICVPANTQPLYCIKKNVHPVNYKDVFRYIFLLTFYFTNSTINSF